MYIYKYIYKINMINPNGNYDVKITIYLHSKSYIHL